MPLIIPLGLFQIFPKIGGDIRSSRCTTGVVDTGGKWKKSSIRKVFVISFGHLWVVELSYRYIFSFKFILSCQQSDIVPIVCHRCRFIRSQICRRCCWYRWQLATGVVVTGGKFATGIIDTGGKFATGINNTSETGSKICRRCRWYRWCTLTFEYLRQFSKKFVTVLMEYSGAGGKLTHKKNQKQKISWHCPFKGKGLQDRIQINGQKLTFPMRKSWKHIGEIILLERYLQNFSAALSVSYGSLAKLLIPICLFF